MDIHVDSRRINREVKEVVRLLICRYELLVTLHHGLVEIGMPHVASVDHQILQRISTARVLRHADKSLHGHNRCGCRHRDHLFFNRFTEQVGDPLLERTAHQLVDQGVIMDQLQIYLRIDQCHTFKFTGDIGELHGIFFQKFPSGRDIEKQILDHQIATHSACHGFLGFNLGTADHQPGSDLTVGGTGFQFHLSNGTDRSESLATETHRMERKQIIGLNDLGGGMTFKSHPRIRIAHPLTIIDNLNQGASGILYDNLHRLRTGINSILHQLLHYGSRSLYHLSGSNLIGNGIGK